MYRSSTSYPLVESHKDFMTNHFATSLSLRAFRDCLRALITPLHIPLVLFGLLECFCQLGTFIGLVLIPVF